MTAYDRGMRELLEECRSSAFDAKEYSLCDRIDAALRTPVPPIFDAFCTAREQRDEARAEVEHWKEAAKQHAENHVAAVEACIRAERERDEARAEVERLKSDSSWGALRRLDDEWRAESSAAYRRGAEAMREAAVREIDCTFNDCDCRGDMHAKTIRDLPIPEDKP